MGICVACFERDNAGALGLHRAALVQYIRPEILAFVLGSFVSSLAFKEFSREVVLCPLSVSFLAFCHDGRPCFPWLPMESVFTACRRRLERNNCVCWSGIGMFMGVQFIKGVIISGGTILLINSPGLLCL